SGIARPPVAAPGGDHAVQGDLAQGAVQGQTRRPAPSGYAPQNGQDVAVHRQDIGLLGLGLGSILTMYMALPRGPEIIATAFAGTGLIFLGLSGYALTSKKDFSFMGGFLFAGIMVVFIAAIANIFLAMPALSLAVSGGIILLMSGFILFDTSRIINGGETNYIMATYGLYLNMFNIFISLLQILGIMSSDE
ncbi:MAG: Bax inhibitor-1 family protein, partial [Chromatiaceae bacterium]